MTTPARASGESVFWLIRPDETFEVKAYEPEDVPDELRWVVEAD